MSIEGRVFGFLHGQNLENRGISPENADEGRIILELSLGLARDITGPEWYSFRDCITCVGAECFKDEKTYLALCIGVVPGTSERVKSCFPRDYMGKPVSIIERNFAQLI